MLALATLAVLLGYYLALLAIVVGLAVLLAQGAPFVRSRPETIQRMITLIRVQPGEKAADLGAGDGSVVIALARAGAEAHGFELNPLLVWRARRNIRRAGLQDRATVHRKNFWKANLSSFDVIAVFGIPHIMRRLEVKLRRELKPGGRVVSNAFRFPTWQPAGEDHSVYLYRI